MTHFESNFLNESDCYKALFKNASIGIIIMNEKGVIQLVNPFALNIFGYEEEEEEIKGKTIDILIPQRYRAKHAQHHLNYLSNPKSRPMGLGLDLFAVKKNGLEFPVEISLSTHVDNGSKNIIAFVTDITKRKSDTEKILEMNDALELIVEARTKDLIKTMDVLKRSKNNLQKALTFQKTLLDNAKAIIVTVDKDGIIQTFNPEAERELGYKADELIGKHEPLLYFDKECLEAKLKVFSKDHNKKFIRNMELFQTKSRLGTKNKSEWIFVRKNGTKFPVQQSIAVMKDESDKIIGFVSVAFNISKIKEIEDELQKSLLKEKELSELKSRFVSMASHEFRTPLSTILSSTYLLKKYNATENYHKQESHFERIISSANLLIDILNDFLNVGKIEEGKIQVKYSHFNIREMVLKVCNEMINTLQNKQEIRYLHNGNTEVYLDESLLKHILMNLISNASKFSPEKSHIEIRTICKDHTTKLSVADQGIGISVKDQKHLTERFFRGANTAHIQGTGLGLHLVNKYAELMNGTFEFKSKLGKGSEFTILFNASIN